MKNYPLLTIFFVSLLSATASFASVQEYQITPKSPTDTGISFDIPYTFGVHHGLSGQVGGEISIDPSAMTLHIVDLQIPIASMTTGDPLRNCHMREALGINYSHSQFPGQHVCKNNQTPTSGPDSIAYPTIELTLLDVTPVSLSSGTARADARLTLHGISRDMSIPLQVTPKADGTGAIRVQSSFQVSLKDYQVTVIPVFFVNVGDTATVQIDINLEPKSTLTPTN